MIVILSLGFSQLKSYPTELSQKRHKKSFPTFPTDISLRPSARGPHSGGKDDDGKDPKQDVIFVGRYLLSFHGLWNAGSGVLEVCLVSVGGNAWRIYSKKTQHHFGSGDKRTKMKNSGTGEPFAASVSPVKYHRCCKAGRSRKA